MDFIERVQTCVFRNEHTSCRACNRPSRGAGAVTATPSTNGALGGTAGRAGQVAREPRAISEKAAAARIAFFSASNWASL